MNLPLHIDPDDLSLNDDSSTPQSEWDDWFSLAHKNTKANWDVAEENDTDECVEDLDFNDRDE